MGYTVINNKNFEENKLKKGDKLYKYGELKSTEDVWKKIKPVIKDNKIWFSKPELLNDPYELKASYYDYKDEAAKRAAELRNRMTQKTVEILSLTTSCSNFPMWANYADEHKGYCMEFSVQDPKKFFEVIYQTQKCKAINCSPVHYSEDLDANYDMWKLFSTKAKDWSYESEYRVMACHENDEKGELISLEDAGLKFEKLIWGNQCEDDFVKYEANCMGITPYKAHIKEDVYQIEIKKLL